MQNELLQTTSELNQHSTKEDLSTLIWWEYSIISPLDQTKF